MLEGCVPWPHEFAEEYIRSGLWQAKGLADLLDEKAQCHPRSIFLSDKHGQLTYGEVNRQAGRLAGELIGLGLRDRDIALLQLPNIKEFVVVFFALQKIGVVPVMCLPAHRLSEIKHFALATGAKAHFLAPEFRGFDFVAMGKEVQAGAPSLEHIFATGEGQEPGVTYLGPLAEAGSDEVDRDPPGDRPGVDPFDVAFMHLSGGTTGVSKLIPRTHADYLYNCRECARVLEWGSDTRYLAALPVSHNFPLGAPGMVGVLGAGGSVVFSASTEAEAIFGAIEQFRATVLPATPTLLISLLDSPVREKYDLTSLRQAIVGGQRMLPELFDRLCATFPQAEPIQVFGMAEGLTNLVRPHDALDIKRETQGRPASSADEIRIVDEDGVDVEEGGIGELITRGPYTIRGYYRAEEQNLGAFTADGFYRTGDLVRLQAGGNLVVEGRKKDLINRGGEKISVEEVENLILSHDKVQMVAVVAMPDPVMGERGCAFVVPTAGATLTLDQLKEFLLEKKIAKFKLPERLEIVRSFPLTKVGKISKKALRERIASELRNLDDDA